MREVENLSDATRYTSVTSFQLYPTEQDQGCTTQPARSVLDTSMTVTFSQPMADEHLPPKAHCSTERITAPAGQVEVTTQDLVMPLIQDLHELATFEHAETLHMFQPALEQTHENITSLLIIADNF